MSIRKRLRKCPECFKKQGEVIGIDADTVICQCQNCLRVWFEDAA